MKDNQPGIYPYVRGKKILLKNYLEKENGGRAPK